MEKFGERIRELRKERGLTVYELATQLGISRNTLKTLIIENGWGDGKRDFLKKVGATEGEKYSIDAETLKFEIEGKYIGQVYETDNAGNVLPKLRGEFEVPKGYVLPIATSARSFDGRYSGAIPKSQIKARVVPILTW